MSKPHASLPPAGTATVDDQGNSSACVRFAIAKAVANDLYVRKRINVDQQQIMISLVQVKECICATNPMVFNGTELIVQDTENGKAGFSNKSWWKVICQC